MDGPYISAWDTCLLKRGALLIKRETICLITVWLTTWLIARGRLKMQEPPQSESIQQQIKKNQEQNAKSTQSSVRSSHIGEGVRKNKCGSEIIFHKFSPTEIFEYVGRKSRQLNREAELVRKIMKPNYNCNNKVQKKIAIRAEIQVVKSLRNQKGNG